MNKVRAIALNQKGIAHLLLPIILLLGIIAAVYLVTTGNLKIFPKAGGSSPVGPQTSFSLAGPKVCSNGWACFIMGTPQPKEEFDVKLYARSDIEQANLFTAKMTFPKDLVEVREIKTEGSFITKWVENFYDNETGEVSLVGGVLSPGFKTQTGGESALMAVIVFEAKALGKGAMSFTDDSAIYSNLNNINILTSKTGYDISVELSPSPEPSADSKPLTITEGGVTTSYNPWAVWLKGSGLSKDLGVLVFDGKEQWEEALPFTLSEDRTWGSFQLPANALPSNCNVGKTCSMTVKLQQSKTGILSNEFKLTIPLIDSAPIPVPGAGDGNKDGKFDLVDLSVLLSSYPQAKGEDNKNYKKEVDMNGDGVINVVDFTMMRNLLVQKGVIRPFK